MTKKIAANKKDISACVYTQITDVELPPRDSDPQKLLLGPKKLFTMEIPYRKYCLDPGDTSGGRNRAHRLSSSATAS